MNRLSPYFSIASLAVKYSMLLIVALPQFASDLLTHKTQSSFQLPHTSCGLLARYFTNTFLPSSRILERYLLGTGKSNPMICSLLSSLVRLRNEIYRNQFDFLRV